MGTWDAGAFANDDALDWSAELESASDERLLQAALQVVAENEKNHLEVPECNVALAAAEVVAALRGCSNQGFPTAVQDWVRGRQEPRVELLQLARKAVNRILSSSELQRLWESSPDLVAWQRSMIDLRDRLT